MSRSSKGDPRVLFVMNLVLSVIFSTLVIWGLSYVTDFTFAWLRVAGLTLVVMVITHFVTR